MEDREYRMKKNEEKLEEPTEAARDLADRLGLEPYDVDYWLVDYDEMNELAAKGGFQERYPHWKWGMKYDEQYKKDKHGLGRIYELVANDNPARGYLQESNSVTDQKLVISHVEAHSDFFANNQWFMLYSDGDPDAAAMLERNGDIIEEYMSDKDIDRNEVERLIDDISSIETNINVFNPFMERAEEDADYDAEELTEQELRSKIEAMELPDEVKDSTFTEEWIQDQLDEDEEASFPEEPKRDIIKFLRDHGKRYDEEQGKAVEMEDWEEDVIERMREEAYYFAPQRMTKVMNEGWAAYWHDTMMSREAFADDDGILDYSATNAGVLGGDGSNPYSLGRALWKHFENTTNRDAVTERLLQIDGVTAKNMKDTIDFDAVYDELAAEYPLEDIRPDTLDDMKDLDPEKLDLENLVNAEEYVELTEELGLEDLPLFEIQQLDPDEFEGEAIDGDEIYEAVQEHRDYMDVPEELEQLQGMELDREDVEFLATDAVDVRQHPWKVLEMPGLAERHYSLNEPDNHGFIEQIPLEQLQEKEAFIAEPDRYDSVEDALADLDYTQAWDEMRSMMESHNDATFIDTILDQEFVDDNNMFAYENFDIPGEDAEMPIVTSVDAEDVRNKMVFEHTNFGKPTIKIHDANYTPPEEVQAAGVKGNAGGLLLKHHYNGVEMDLGQSVETMKRVQRRWGQDIHLKTVQKEWDDEALMEVMHEIQQAQQAKQQKAHPDYPDPPDEALEPDIEMPEPEEHTILITYDGEHLHSHELVDDDDPVMEASDLDYSTIPDDWLYPVSE